MPFDSQCVSLLPRMSTSASPHLTFLLLILAFFWSLAWQGSLLSGSGQVGFEQELLLGKGWDLLLMYLWTGTGLPVHWGPYFTHWPCEIGIITLLQRGSRHPPSSSQKHSVSHTNCLSLLEWLVLLLFISSFSSQPTPQCCSATMALLSFFSSQIFFTLKFEACMYMCLWMHLYFLYIAVAHWKLLSEPGVAQVLGMLQ